MQGHLIASPYLRVVDHEFAQVFKTHRSTPLPTCFEIFSKFDWKLKGKLHGGDAGEMIAALTGRSSVHGSDKQD
jgi:hypothetical protein